MKFKFCGDTDCQDWILAQINVCSKLTSIKLKLITKEVINHILTEKLNFPNLCKLTSDAKLSEEETKAAVAALNFIIISSAKYNCDSETLSNELQQLGLPREHSVSLSKSYAENYDKIKQLVKERSLKLSSLTESYYEITPSFESDNCTVHCPSLLFTLKGNSHDAPVNARFHMMPDQLGCMIKDLKEAVQLMESSMES